MRAAAPRATVHMLHESNGFSIYLDEATAVRRITQLGVLTDHAEDILEETVPVLFVPLEQCVRFVEEVTAFHSVGLVDVTLADKVNNARYVMYAYFPRCSRSGVMISRHAENLTRLAEEKLRARLAEHDGCSRWGAKDSIALRPVVSGHIRELDGTVTTLFSPAAKTELGELRQQALVESIVSSVVPYDIRTQAIDQMAATLFADPPKEKDSLDADFWG